MQDLETRLGQAESVARSRESGTRNEAETVNDEVKNSTKAKSKNRAANMAALQLLIDAYPKTFDRQNVRPLKIGIQEDLVAEGKIAKNKIKRALASYVRSLSYYRSLREGAERIDLSGEAAGVVTQPESEHARDKLKEINKNRQVQRKKKEQDERLQNKLEMLVGRK
ncbi:ProQ/FINO family protein [Pontibacter sp. JAM-7]|uniref:ProQ/FINO family protein n=1 Tax=Pontibacter sp. JAM-7 TaxID=3366581 RepID=UPI003AF6B28A